MTHVLTRAAFALAIGLSIPLTGCFETITGPYDGPPVVEFEQRPGGYVLAVTEASGQVQLKVNLVGAQRSSDLVLNVRVDESSTAVAGEDYSFPNGTQVTIPANASSAFFPITIVDDSDVNNDVRLALELEGTAEVAATENWKDFVITIRNDDTPPMP